MTDGPILTIDGLVLHYGEARALDGVSLSVGRGELVSVVGANGAGKTSLIRAIAGMLRPSAGSIRFDGMEIAGRDSNAVCELGIGQVAEGRCIFPSLSVQENLELGGALKRSKARRARNLEIAFETFPRLAERRRQAAGTLSGGEQQMLAISRCLMAEPVLIMFDEPSLGLSPLLTEQMFEVVETLNANGTTVLLVEQNVMQSLEISSRGYVLENGRVELEGTGADLLTNDRVRAAYLGL
ncbi:ABC transporter ATP-binding protein [Amorphus orientalis]|uniref:Branched-chain amino acid transport system ATP-binding protein n=1 Tax=Amorphus orientalis TaxID=649198 RepID=A0AAE3VLW3_9HYPH|nr:ABC transporter ATP-binding protein [Amorphus orientalis]MDQ0314453.1 branched-chain amino acid transport system ATP-binding protein [Amorphus orientalis]